MLMLAAALTLAIQPAEFTAEQALEDLAVARETLERLHPGYDRYADRAALDAAWVELEAAAADGADLNELYLGLSALLTDIRCDHTKAELPGHVAEYRETAPVYLPFRFELFDGRMFVDIASEASGLQRGEEIIALDGDPIADRLAGVRRFMPVDGFTDHVRDVGIQDSAEFLGSGFDQFDPMLNPIADTVTLTVRHGLRTRQVVADRIGYAEFRTLRGQSRWRNFSDEGSVSVERPDADTAILSVETFVNYRTPVNPNAVFSPIFEQLNAEGVDRLIVDMRRNGGGSTDAMIGLLSHLTRTETRINQEVWVTTYDFDGLRDHIRTWDPAALNPDPRGFRERAEGGFEVVAQVDELVGYFQPAAHAFEGEVIILTSRTNASGATQLIGALNGQDHITLVGEATGGSQEGPTAGVIWFVDLPNSEIVVRVPWLFQRSSVTDPVFGQGYDPDIEAVESYASWMAGQDPAMEAALAHANR